FTLGTDTGGSVRIPAACCGVVGLKPTYGIISFHGVYPLAWSIDHVGIMARRVRDVAYVLEAIVGNENTELPSVPAYARDLVGDVKQLRIGVLRSYFFDVLDSEVRAAVEEAVGNFVGLGARVQDVFLPNLDEVAAAARIVLLAEGASCLEKFHRTKAKNLGTDIQARLTLGSLIPAISYIKAQRLRRYMYDKFLNIFQDVDVVVTPCLPITAPEISATDVVVDGVSLPVAEALTRLTRIYNILGLPAITIPCGFSRGGLPIGLQIAGRPFNEGVVLRVAEAYERSARWHEKRPHLPSPNMRIAGE
ncbi:MAG: Asp-tRNA(Asn)/Glu-tRNA(Gln) amidotransferase GatCAB subunit A, partial [Candidatus Tectomicrobia bacterium]|nr:Asp-tRNA(Asn)/Glu-tRNA(Gln) amidotransferase GatCAB subunit A [Candidatus Tectomicrobia bacterium]